MLSFSFSRKREKVSREGATDEGNGVQEIATPSPDPAKSPSLATGVFTDALWPGHPLPHAGEGSRRRLRIKPEMHHVAVGDNIFLAFQP